MLHDEMQGHDARLDGVDFDIVKKTVAIRLLAYAEKGASERVSFTILFEGVTSVVFNADLVTLANNRSFGNVNHWHIAETQGTSHVYLIEGHIAISAQAAPRLIRR